MRPIPPLLGCLIGIYASMMPTPAFGQTPVLVLHAPSDLGERFRSPLQSLATQANTLLIDLSSAPLPQPTAAKRLTAAIEAFQQVEFDMAEKMLDTLVAEIEQSGGRGLDRKQLSDVFIYRGLLSEKKQQSGWDDFISAAAIDPSRKLDAARFPPSVLDTWKRAVTVIEGSRRPTIQIDLPDGCTTRVDASLVTTNQPIPLAIGRHFLYADCQVHLPFGSTFEVISTTTHFEPVLTPMEPPTLSKLRKRMATRGLTSFILVRISRISRISSGVLKQIPSSQSHLGPHRTHKAGSIATISLVDVASGTVEASQSLDLAGDNSALLLTTQISKLIDRAAQPLPIRIQTQTITVIEHESVPWYRRGWFVGAVVGLAAVAIIVPLAIDNSGSKGLSANLGGVPW